MKNVMYFFVFSILFLGACANEVDTELISDPSFLAREAGGGVIVRLPNFSVYHHRSIIVDSPEDGCIYTGSGNDYCCTSGLGCDIGEGPGVIEPFNPDWNHARAKKYLTAEGLENMLIAHINIEEETVIYEILATTIDYKSYGPVSEVFTVNSTKDGDVELGSEVSEALGYSSISLLNGKYEFESSGDKEDLLRGTIKMKAIYE